MAGIYIHIPFCKQACSYCNFHFSTLQNTKNEVLVALHKEIQLQQHFFPDKTVIESIYFGGGTPSLLSTAELNTLLETLYRTFTIAADAEITLEANPDDLSQTYLNALKRETPVNRFSIGIQSFFEADLLYMNRAHNAAEAKACIQLAQDTGFDNLSVDLIYGTPTLSNENWLSNLHTVFDLQVPHVSCYALTVEEKTALAHQIKRQAVTAPDDEQTAQQFLLLLEHMKAAGYTHYEISNFCREPNFARHNTNYWRGIPYLGLGPSAHSYDGKRRSWNIANNALYAKQLQDDTLAQESELLSIKDHYNEYIMTALRTMWGIDAAKIEAEFGDEFLQHFLSEIPRYTESGHVLQHENIFQLSDAGKLLCDAITQHLFFPE
jgi:oxygen-independent coproporphyrinogen III oxidase